MSNFLLKFFRLFILFSRNTVGCINKPYVTYRKLADEKTDSWQTVYIFILVIGYFAFASLIRAGLKNPFLLTFKFNSLFLGGLTGFFFIILLLAVFGRIIGSQIRLKTVFTLWSFSLLPTIVWFFATSILYVVFPPPRTLTVLGKAYSLLYIAFSLALLFWKLILYYLTLRFGLRLVLAKIMLVSLLVIPSLISYSLLMYRLGIFRIPFI